MSQAERSNQRFIMVTGASSGIGRATTARLADAGHMAFAAARRASALQALAAEHPRARPVVLDVTDQTSIDSAAGQVAEATGGHGLDVRHLRITRPPGVLSRRTASRRAVGSWTVVMNQSPVRSRWPWV